MRLRWSVIVLTTLVLASCSKEDAGNTGRVPVSFDATATQLETKAANEMTLSQLQSAHFGVFASYTGKLLYEQTSVVPDFMYNQEVSWSNPNWVYTPVKYWPNADEYVTFFAYAPYEAAPAPDKCIAGFSPSDELGDPWLLYRLASDPAQQVDLLYGVNATTGEAWFDQQKPAAASGKIAFQFRHALACMGENVTVKATDALMTRLSGVGTLYIKNVTVHFVNLTAKARLVLNAHGEPNWKPVVSGDFTTTRSVSKDMNRLLSTTPFTASSGEGLFYIPLHLEGQPQQRAYVTVDYTLHLTSSGANRNGTSQSGVFVLDGTVGTKQGIAVTITENLEVISHVETLNGILPGPQTAESGFTPTAPY